MLKRVTAYLLIVSLLSAHFSRFFIFAGFELNKNYIVTKLCENRDKPWMHCNGKCYFMKKLKQAQDNDRNSERQSQRNLFQEAFFAAHTPIKFQSSLLRVIITPYNPGELRQFNGTLFRPPRIA
jgi:hypothetical protein